MCWNGDGKIVEAVGRRGQEVNRSIALPLCLMSYILLHRRSVSQGWISQGGKALAGSLWHDLDNALMARWIRFSLWVWGGCVNPYSVPEPQAAESKGPWWKALATTTSYHSWHLQSVACTMFTPPRTKLANPPVITNSDLTVTHCKRVKKSDYQFHLMIM